MPTLKQNGLSIVLVGDFNTRIFQPSWFVAQKLIAENEGREASDLFITEQIATFRLPWFWIQVTTQQFMIVTVQDSHFEALRDLVVGSFRLLRHTPIRQLGINIEQHYLCETVERWNAFGDKLAPKQTWLTFMKEPGLLNMRMMDKQRRDGGPPGTTYVDVQSSMVAQPGLFFRINNHYEMQGGSGAEDAVKILENNFDPALEGSKRIVETLLSHV